MKITKISEHIWSIKQWLIIPITVWVVIDKEGVTLVDAGIAPMSKGILNFIESLQAGPLLRIILTHGHMDHVGAIKNIVKHTPIPVVVHRIEIPYIEGEIPYPRRKKATVTIDKGLSEALLEDNQGQLLSVAGLKPYLAPGHAPGHVVYYHEEDGVLLAGDLFTSKRGKLNRPMPIFTANMPEAIKSAAIVRELKPLRIEVCHGNSVLNPIEHIDEYIRAASSRYPEVIV